MSLLSLQQFCDVCHVAIDRFRKTRLEQRSYAPNAAPLVMTEREWWAALSRDAVDNPALLADVERRRKGRGLPAPLAANRNWWS